MTFEERLYQFLSESPEISNLVGDRIYPDIAPEETEAPYIVYTIVSNVPSYTLEGNTGNTVRRVQIAIYSKGRIESANIENAVIAVMDDWHNQDSKILTVSMINSINGYEGQTKFYSKILDFSVGK